MSAFPGLIAPCFLVRQPTNAPAKCFTTRQSRFPRFKVLFRSFPLTLQHYPSPFPPPLSLNLLLCFLPAYNYFRCTSSHQANASYTVCCGQPPSRRPIYSYNTCSETFAIVKSVYRFDPNSGVDGRGRQVARYSPEGDKRVGGQA